MYSRGQPMNSRGAGFNTRRNSFSNSSKVGTLSVLQNSCANGESTYKYISCRINGRYISLLIDLGARVSILHKSVIFSMWPRPTIYPPKLTLKSYKGDDIPTLGMVYLTVEFETQRIQQFEFYVVHRGTNLMGVNLFDALKFKISSNEGSQINKLVERQLAINSDWRSNPTANQNAQRGKISNSVNDRGGANPYHLFSKYPEMLSTTGLRVIKGFSHKPFINPTIPPVAQPLRRLPLSMETRVMAELEQMQRDGIIEPIDASPWVSNMVITPKPNDKLRICGDMRNVNKAISPDKYPLPTIEELSKFFAGATVFSKIDLKSGYWQVEMAPESRYLTAMITQKGLFQWKRVPFGLSSAPSCFQKIIRMIIADCEGATNLLDDIAIAGIDLADHDRKLDKVLSCLNKFHATINFEKSKFGVASINFVGFTVSASGVRPLQSNVEAVANTTRPINAQQVHSFLSTANYYLKFVRDFATVAEPLRRLLRKEVEFEWTDECQYAFDEIKRQLTSRPTLAHFDINARTIVSTDASGVALGAVLSQVQRGEERPIAYASRTLNSYERTYSVGEREALACIWAIEHWHYYLYGRKFVLRTDHSALTSLLGAGSTGRKPMRLLRWTERLQEYNYDIVFRPGKDNSVADFLSRPVQNNSRGEGNSDTQSNNTSALSKNESFDETSDVRADEKFLNTIFGTEALRAINRKELADATKTDQMLKLIRMFINNGWSSKKSANPDLSAYWDVRDELSIVEECIFRSSRAVIPISLRVRVMQ